MASESSKMQSYHENDLLFERTLLSGDFEAAKAMLADTKPAIKAITPLGKIFISLQLSPAAVEKVFQGKLSVLVVKVLARVLLHEILPRQICAALYSEYPIPAALRGSLTMHAFWSKQDDLLSSLIDSLERRYPDYCYQRVENLDSHLDSLYREFGEDEKQQIEHVLTKELKEITFKKLKELIPDGYGKSLMEFFSLIDLVALPTPNPMPQTATALSKLVDGFTTKHRAAILMIASQRVDREDPVYLGNKAAVDWFIEQIGGFKSFEISFFRVFMALHKDPFPAPDEAPSSGQTGPQAPSATSSAKSFGRY